MAFKLAYICGSSSWGGLEMNQVRNAIWMQEKGYDVALLCWQNSPIALEAQKNQIQTYIIPKHKKYYDFKNGKKLSKLLQENNFSHLIVRSTYDMSISAYAKSKLRKKLHLSYFMEMQFGVKKTNLLHTLRFNYFDLWSCPLNFLANQVKTMTRFPHHKIVVIPSAIDLYAFNAQQSKEEARKILDLPEKELIFGLIGRFDPQKGQMLLLEAMKKCSNQNFSLAFLGEPTKNEGDTFFNSLTEFIQKNNLENRVFIRPFRKDIASFYKAIDWFVMASKAETFGMVTIEAMACGTPTLGSKAGGTPEILEFGKLGVLFETLNSSDLASKMNEIIENQYQIDDLKLKEAVLQYDHRTICNKVEQNLALI